MKTILSSAAIVAASAFSAQAATLSESDLIIDGGQEQAGNCPISAPCYRVNSNDLVTITLDGGGLFTLTGFSYTLQGQPSTLELTTNLGGFVLETPAPGPATTVYFADLTGEVGFTDVTSIQFDNIGQGTFRIDGFVGSFDDPSQVPLPAAGLMLLTALGGAAALRRRG